MQTKQHGGRRAGAGRPIQVADRLILLEVAAHLGDLVPRREGVSIRQAQNVIKKHGASSVIGAKREAQLRALAGEPDAPIYLKMLETIYRAKRYEAGFGDT